MSVLGSPPAQWRASATPSTPGFVLVPKVDDVEAERWIADETAMLRRLWGDDWRDDSAEHVDAILRGARRSADPATLFDLLYWPYSLPVVARVRARIGPSVPVQEWAEHGFRLDVVEPGGIGTGVRCTRVETLRSGDAEVTIVETHVVFDDGVDSVVVTVEPARSEIAAHMLPGLSGILGTLEVARPDGSAFRGVRPAGLAEVDGERWDAS